MEAGTLLNKHFSNNNKMHDKHVYVTLYMGSFFISILFAILDGEHLD